MIPEYIRTICMPSRRANCVYRCNPVMIASIGTRAPSYKQNSLYCCVPSRPVPFSPLQFSYVYLLVSSSLGFGFPANHVDTQSRPPPVRTLATLLKLFVVQDSSCSSVLTLQTDLVFAMKAWLDHGSQEIPRVLLTPPSHIALRDPDPFLTGRSCKSFRLAHFSMLFSRIS